MKKTKIIYWIFTGIFAALMLFAAISEIQNGPDAVSFMARLGYPRYLNPFLGVTKLLGVTALLVPGFPRIKEWAYAGFVIDLVGATYSVMAAGPFDPKSLFMFIWFIPLILSYVFYHRILAAK